MRVNEMPVQDRLKKGDLDLGTTIMAVTFNGGVVVAADSRTSTGNYIANRVTDKLTKIHDRIYCCRSGSAADTQAVADMVRYYAQITEMEREEAPTVHTVATLFNRIVYGNKDALTAGILVAGWDKYDGPSVYSIPLGGGIFKNKWSIQGSGSAFIYGYFDRHWREGWGRDETVKFVKDAVALAIGRDGSSGGVIRVAVITEEGVERQFMAGNELPSFDGYGVGGTQRGVDNVVAA